MENSISAIKTLISPQYGPIVNRLNAFHTQGHSLLFKKSFFRSISSGASVRATILGLENNALSLSSSSAGKGSNQAGSISDKGWMGYQRRSFYASKWERRLKTLLEPKRYAPAPEVPETEVFESRGDVSKIKPIWQTRRCGALAYKIGCMSLWDEWGERHAVTVCHIDRCVVLEQRTLHGHGYEALQLGIGYSGIHKQSKNNIGRYIKLGLEPKHVVHEFKCSSDAFLPVGHEISARHFTPGQWVFVSGWSKGKGFMGPMKRWGFAGGRASHGTEGKAHSHHGAVSQGHSVNVIWKHKKMAGHHGPDPRVNNCKVFRIEAFRNLIFLKGCVPGYRGSVVKISDARGRTWHKNKNIYIPYPTFVPKPKDTYPVTLQCPPSTTDPFIYPEIPLYDKKE